MFYLAVVLEKGQLVDRSLDPQKQPELVLEFPRYRAHGVLDPRALDADMEPVAHLPFGLRVELVSRKGGHVVRLDGVNRRPRQVVLDGRYVRLFAENDAGRVFAPVPAPVLLHAEGTEDRAIGLGALIQLAVHPFRFPTVHHLLCTLPVRYLYEGVVQQTAVDLRFPQLAGQPTVTLAVDLQTAGPPGRHPHRAPAQFFVDAVEIVM